MKIQLLLIALILSITTLKSQPIPDYIATEPGIYEQKFNCNHLERYKHSIDNPLAIPDNARPYDVLNYDIYLDWSDMLSKPDRLDSNGLGYITASDVTWTGTNTITLVPTQNDLASIELDANSLKINKITLNGVEVTPTPQPLNGLLSVKLINNYKTTDTLVFKIDYTFNRFISPQQYYGFFLYPKRQYIGIIDVAPYDTAFVEEKLAYTMNEPEDCRYWLPCNDRPYDKAIVTVKVDVPPDFSVASNGLLTKLDKTSGKWRYTWEDDTPIATYLVSVTASKFHEFSDWYTRNDGKKIEVQYYVWEKDFQADKKDRSQYNAHWTFEQNVEQIGTYSKLYGEYPYKKYGLVALMPFNYGGMEHQTITAIARPWLRNNERGGLAHELAHQWLGDLITCADWNDIWINEGGATFSETLWNEHNGDRSSAFESMVNNRNYYLRQGGLDLPAIRKVPKETMFYKNVAVVYHKSSWVYHMLRTMLGDSAFFRSIKSLLNKYQHTSIDYKQFQKSFEEDNKNPLVSFETYFNQWMYKTGHPLFEMSTTAYNVGNNKYEMHLNLSQFQDADSISAFFEVPVRVTITGKNNETYIDTLLQTKRDQEFIRTLDFYPVSAVIDTSFILCEIRSNISSVKEANNVILSNITPNPIKRGDIAKINYLQENLESKITVELFNSLGVKIRNIFNGSLDKRDYEFNFETKDLTPGVFFIKVTNNTETNIIKAVIVD